MLTQRGVDFHYREYTKDPLTGDELRKVLGMLGVGPKQVLRTNDKAYKELGLTGDESEDELIAHMVAHPTLLQRPIGVAGGRAVLGRPPENLLALR